MKHLVTILLVCLSMFKVEMIYTGEPVGLLWGNPESITYDSNNHIWINNNPLSENWRWADSDQRDKLLEPETVPERKRIEVSVNSFWKLQDGQFKLPVVAVVFATTRKSLVDQAVDSIDESWINPLDHRLAWYRPRETFCPVTRALAENDEANVLGYAGAATDDLILSIELDRRERRRVARWRIQA